MRDAELRALGRETFFLSLGMLILLVAIGAASVVFTLWLLVLLPLWLVGTVHVGKYLDRKYGVGAYPED